MGQLDHPNRYMNTRTSSRISQQCGWTSGVAVVDSCPSSLASLRRQSSPWGCLDDLSDPNTARARPHGRPEGDGESSEGVGSYRICLLLQLVAHLSRDHADQSSVGD